MSQRYSSETTDEVASTRPVTESRAECYRSSNYFLPS